jgi:hypothetical protein
VFRWQYEDLTELSASIHNANSYHGLQLAVVVTVNTHTSLPAASVRIESRSFQEANGSVEVFTFLPVDPNKHDSAIGTLCTPISDVALRLNVFP